MTILLFIVVLVVLIVVHEFGHFVAAKWSGMRVDEFGIGYPPRAAGFRHGETEYTINWLPFGGFVKIYGEDGDATGTGRAFADKPKWRQAAVLVAGIAMNLILAWALLSITLALGTPRVLTAEEATRADDAVLMVASVLPGSPADDAGLVPGDVIRDVTAGGPVFAGASPEAFTAFIASQEPEMPLSLTFARTGEAEPRVVHVTPERGVVEADPERLALGVGVASVGTLPVPLHEAPWEGLLITIEATRQTALGLVEFFASLLTLSADLSSVSGPVGIAGAVGVASESGLAALLSITAVISINLALINLLPVPALDGGRLLFVLIEAVIRRRIPAPVAGAVNAVGFMLLILLMVVVTANDLFRLFS